jgi:hypothetical protein
LTISAKRSQRIPRTQPSYDRATFDRIKLALDSASPPSFSRTAKAEGLSKQTVFRLKQVPQAALDAWGM